MAENSKIEWTTHTWNPWRGCTKVSAGCAHCYAETQSKRNPTVLGEWGPNGTRVFAAPKAWHEPYRWDDDCRRCEDRARVFSLSLGDWLEDWPGQLTNQQGELIYYSPTDPRFDPWTTNQIVPHKHFEPYTLDVARVRLLRTVHDTPHLDWLLLTKRPENWHAKMLAALRHLDKTPECGSDFSRWLRAWVHERKPPANVWAGASVENQDATSRIPHLRAIPARVHWISVEPLLGPLDLRGKLVEWNRDGSTYFSPIPHSQAKQLIDWIIVGGESGYGARPCNVAWIRSIVNQCKAASISCFVKQLGGNVECRNDEVSEWLDECGICLDEVDTSAVQFQGDPVRVFLIHRKGGNMAEWPGDLRVREFPMEPAHA